MSGPGAFVLSGDRIVGAIGAPERQLLQQLLGSVAGMLEADDAGAADPLAELVGWDDEAQVPVDPALRRLLPDGVHDDEEAALEFRRFTERSLRQGKVSALKAAAVMLESRELQLSREQAEILVRALNDIRLVLAERLDLYASAADSDAAPSALDPEATERDGLSQLYYFVTFVHGRLVLALLEMLRRDADTDPDTPDTGAGSGSPEADHSGPQQ
ncbi:DUF2017 domain-containing protein [Acaricomes phytoseiuli]|uniref:DUF2017 domain-containing protein n=1 Tax=Acaricomes phytoseiuli TaxID=291968 RepID=UPI0022225AA9|nr:DUF2017 domain-containing protein [Acaricomes phytoseiuli]MCW1248745.1 DUF2017 domain-containing protein [Acaricomes phytoseiuli]